MHTLAHIHTQSYTHAHTHTIIYNVAIRYLITWLKLALLKFLFQFHNVAMAITSSIYVAIATYPIAIIIGQLIPPHSFFYQLLYKAVEWLSK